MTDSDRGVNPYEVSSRTDNSVSKASATPIWRTSLAGALWSVVAVFPIAALMALLFRFPVPFAGIRSGPAAIVPAMFAVLFYGVFMGGLILVAIGGLVAGACASLIGGSNLNRRRIQRCLSILVAFVLVFLLATLDWYIGNW